ncbi:Uncharacterized protein DBV15_01399 [Temnothorax longispinosus]|uniref:Uncharacterized protein n=1 Tax=Temnothorax longispinosus TaxID=300112 RepID=A0A4S2KZ87_9HYME|nr:Uncharacterized protein DBV15_01399 [Temnothorax longispinosus]
MSETRGLPIARVTLRVGPPRRWSASFSLAESDRDAPSIGHGVDQIDLGVVHELRRTRLAIRRVTPPVN